MLPSEEADALHVRLTSREIAAITLEGRTHPDYIYPIGDLEAWSSLLSPEERAPKARPSTLGTAISGSFPDTSTSSPREES